MYISFSGEDKDQSDTSNENRKKFQNITVSSQSTEESAKTNNVSSDPKSKITSASAIEVLNPSEIKVEAKDELEEKSTCYSPSAPGGTQLPIHALNAKHAVSVFTGLQEQV